MNFHRLRAIAVLTFAVTSTPVIAAEPATQIRDAEQKTVQAVDVIDEILSMHRAGVDPAVLIGHLKSLPELPRLSAADIIQLQENAVSSDVMSALILMTVPEKSRLSADDIVQMHQKRVPSDIISAMIDKARKTSQASDRTTASSATAKPNPKYLLAMPRTSSTIIIPYRPYYYSPYYRGNYYGQRYYGPTLSYGFGYGYGCGHGYGNRYCW